MGSLKKAGLYLQYLLHPWNTCLLTLELEMDRDKVILVRSFGFISPQTSPYGSWKVCDQKSGIRSGGRSTDL
jgi:hypothetical protein